MVSNQQLVSTNDAFPAFVRRVTWQIRLVSTRTQIFVGSWKDSQMPSLRGILNFSCFISDNYKLFLSYTVLDVTVESAFSISKISNLLAQIADLRRCVCPPNANSTFVTEKNKERSLLHKMRSSAPAVSEASREIHIQTKTPTSNDCSIAITRHFPTTQRVKP
jgi:hypothetical protein